MGRVFTIPDELTPTAAAHPRPDQAMSGKRLNSSPFKRIKTGPSANLKILSREEKGERKKKKEDSKLTEGGREVNFNENTISIGWRWQES